MTSAPKPMRVTASCATTARFVFFTLATRAASSSGCSVRGSITSTEMPSASASTAASSERCTSTAPSRSRSTSVPSPRITRALPIGIGSSSVGTSPFHRRCRTGARRLRREVRIVDRRPGGSPRTSSGVEVADHLQARNVHQPGLGCRACCTPGDHPAPPCDADRQRHRQLSARHVAVLGGLVDDLLERERPGNPRT